MGPLCDYSRPYAFIRTDIGSVRLQTRPETIPLSPRSIFGLKLSRLWAFRILALPVFFFLLVSCSGLLGKEGVVQQQRRVLLRLTEGCSSLGFNI